MLAASATEDTAAVLVLDDDTLVLRALESTLKRRYRVHCASSGERAIELLAEHPDIAVAIVDQRMPGMSGPEFIRRTVEPYPHLVRIILTGYQDIHSLKEAINNGGAYRYLEKPCPNADLLAAMEGAVELHYRLVDGAQKPVELAAANEALLQTNRLLEIENLQLRLDAECGYDLGGRMVGSSPALVEVLAAADRVADSDTTVLILGETGTGKELVARYLHDKSSRGRKTFRAQNCSAVAEQLMEDTLFGHVPGAFTGARSLRKGLFEIADGGTLLLDEIGDCPPSLQAKLLRVVEERVIHRLGDDEHSIPVDVRLIAATHRDLRQDVETGRFRQDLYYRLNVFSLRVPALRERRTDIPELAVHFIGCLNERARKTSGKYVTAIGPDALAALDGYELEGNVRELANLIERAWLYADDGGTIGAEHVLPHLTHSTRRLDAVPLAALLPESAEPGPPQADALPVSVATDSVPLRDAVRSFKSDFIAKALERNHWNVAATARDLGITRTSLYEEIKESGLRRPD